MCFVLSIMYRFISSISSNNCRQKRTIYWSNELKTRDRPTSGDPTILISSPICGTRDLQAEIMQLNPTMRFIRDANLSVRARMDISNVPPPLNRRSAALKSSADSEYSIKSVDYKIEYVVSICFHSFRRINRETNTVGNNN